MNPFLKAVRALHEAKCRYVIVGGFAVVMYGNNRFTPDVNVVLELDEDNLALALRALIEAEMVVDLEINALDFVDQVQREDLRKSMGKMFFSLNFPSIPFFSVELFYNYPLAFDELYDQSVVISFDQGEARICSRKHLVEMKEGASRPQDLADIDNLKAIDLIQTKGITDLADAAKVEGAPSTIDLERIKDLISFLQTSSQKKLDWLEEMLSALGHFSGF